ncbi:MAG: AMP-binding protein [Lachnospiraceae bacterium]|nr:AMP-binding protein [Lachnospiraceae bacterium]
MIWDLERYAEREALTGEGISIRYRVLREKGDEICRMVPKRSLVFVLCRNKVATIAAYTGFLNGGVVPLMLDGKLSPELLASMIGLYEPAFLWLPAERRDEMAGAEEIYRADGYLLLKNPKAAELAMDPSLALLISTSGSTGSPKLVRLSYKNILANTASIIEYLHINERERAITSLPLNYVYGLSVLNTHLYAGGCLILTEQNCYSKLFWDQFERYGGTSFAGIPFMYEMLHKLRFEKKTIPGLKTMTQAGGKLSPELHELFAAYAQENGIDFVVMYGASEATARMGYLPPERSLEKRGSMGIAIPGGRFELIDEAHRVIGEAGQSGELVYYGENVSLGYAEAPEDLNRPDERNGRLETGDMAYFDADGYYYIVGRKSRFIKILGKRTNLAEMEGILKQKFGILDLACSGKDDSLDIYLTDASRTEEIGDYLFEEIGINRHLYHLHVIPEIPKNTAGKVLYSQLKPQEG